MTMEMFNERIAKGEKLVLIDNLVVKVDEFVN